MGAFDDLLPTAKQAGAFDDLVPSKPTNDFSTMRDALRLVPGGQYMPDIVYGAKRALDAAAQMAARGAHALAPDNETLTGMLADTEAANAKTKAAEPAPIQGSSVAQAIPVGVAAGMLAPEGILGAVLAGATSGALEPVDDAANFARQKLKQIGIGTAAGLGGGAAAKAVGRVLSPQTGVAQQTLMNEGVDSLTPGQTLGGVFDKIESKATSVPILGDLIANARMRPVDDLNRAIYTRALAPILGDDAAAGVAAKLPVGNDGIKAVGDKLSAAYESALDKSSPAPLTDAVQASFAKLQSMLPQSREQDFAKTIQRLVYDNVTPAGTLTPTVAKQADSEFGRLTRQYAGSGDPDQRIYSQALAQARSDLKQAFADANPDTAPLIRAADQGWATLVQIENAGSMLGSREGVIGPAQLRNAVKRSDTSLRDRKFAQGNALNQDLADAAAKVLPSKAPDSGTAGRVLQASLGGIGGAMFPTAGAGALAAGGMAALPYTPFGQKLALALLAKRPDLLRNAGTSLASLAAPLGAVGASLVPSGQQ